MKKTITTSALIIGYFMLMSVLGIIASVPANMQRTEKQKVTREITRQIPCPAFVTENSESNDVKALIKISEDGKIEVLQINTANLQLREYVKGKMAEIKCSNKTPVDEFVLVIKFRVA